MDRGLHLVTNGRQYSPIDVSPNRTAKTNHIERIRSNSKLDLSQQECEKLSTASQPIYAACWLIAYDVGLLDPALVPNSRLVFNADLWPGLVFGLFALRQVVLHLPSHSRSPVSASS